MESKDQLKEIDIKNCMCYCVIILIIHLQIEIFILLMFYWTKKCIKLQQVQN